MTVDNFLPYITLTITYLFQFSSDVGLSKFVNVDHRKHFSDHCLSISYVNNKTRSSDDTYASHYARFKIK